MRTILLIIALTFISITAAKPAADDDHGNNAFALAFYDQLPATGNLIFSPASIRTAFAMLAEGSAGATRDEIIHALCFPDHNYATDTLQSNLHKHTQSHAARLQIFNGMWHAQQISILPGFTQTLREQYHCEPQPMNFSDNLTAEIARLNTLIAKHTNNKITSLFTTDNTTADTKFILASVIYFYGKWMSAFEKKDTFDLPFFTRTDTSRPAPFMSQELTTHYQEDSRNQYLLLGYNGDFSMLLVLPKLSASAADSDIPAPTVTISELNAFLAAKRYNRKIVNLRLPRFKIASTPDITAIMRQLGIHTAFTDTANFSGITAEPTLPRAASTILHHAVIEVDEAGTEAAAVTRFWQPFGSISPDSELPVKFHADHPFLFFILDDFTNQILFMGRVTNPAN